MEGVRHETATRLPASLHKALAQVASAHGEVAVDVWSFPAELAAGARAKANRCGAGVVVEAGRALALLVAPEGKQHWATVATERQRWSAALWRGGEVRAGDATPLLMALPLPTREERAKGAVERGHFAFRTELHARHALHFQLPPNPMAGSGGSYSLEDLAFFRKASAAFLRGQAATHLTGQLRQVWHDIHAQAEEEAQAHEAHEGREHRQQHEQHTKNASAGTTAAASDGGDGGGDCDEVMYVRPHEIQERLFRFLTASQPVRAPEGWAELVRLYVTYKLLSDSELFTRARVAGNDLVFRLRSRAEVAEIRAAEEPLRLLASLSTTRRPLESAEEMHRELAVLKREVKACHPQFVEFFLQVKEVEMAKLGRFFDFRDKKRKRGGNNNESSSPSSGATSFLRPEHSRAVLLFLQRQMRSRGRTAADVAEQFSPDEARDSPVLSFVTLLDEDLLRGAPRLCDLYGAQLDEAYVTSLERLARREYSDHMDWSITRALLDPLGMPPSKLLIQRLLLGLGVWRQHDDPRLMVASSAVPCGPLSPTLQQAAAAAAEKARRPPPSQAPSQQCDGEGMRRRDLSRLRCFTIDDPSTEIIDDGISVETEADGQAAWVYVHVADPGRVVEAGSRLEQQARRRAANLYLADGVHEMIPKSLGLASSLSPSHPNATLTFAAKICTSTGALLDLDVFAGRADNVCKVSYAEVDAILSLTAKGSSASSSRRATGEQEHEEEQDDDEEEGYDGMEGAVDSWPLQGDDADALKTLWKLARLRRRHRESTGALLLNLPQAEVRVLDAATCDIAIAEGREESAGRMLVEECMIVAGQAAAAWAGGEQVPLLHRGQRRPKGIVAVEEAHAFLAPFYRIAGYEAAEFSCSRRRHAGLGLDAYTRVTSPLRRYGDLLAHLQIRARLGGRELPYRAAEVQAMATHQTARTQLLRDLQNSSRLFWMLQHTRAALRQGMQPYLLGSALMYLEAPATHWLHAGREGSATLALRGGNAARQEERRGAFRSLPVLQPFYDAVVLDAWHLPIAGAEPVADVLLPQLGCLRARIAVERLPEPGQVLAARLTDAVPFLHRLQLEAVPHRPQYSLDHYHDIYFANDDWWRKQD